MPEGNIEIRLLGGFTVVVDDRDVTDRLLRHRRGAALLKLLALDPGHSLPREQIMDALWPDLPPARAGANLRKAAHHARSALEAHSLFVLDGTVVRFGKEWQVETDIAAFEDGARRALAAEDPEECRRVSWTYAGDLLPGDIYESWSAEPRDRLRALFLRALETGAMWGRLVEVEPCNEKGHQKIITNRLAGGDRAGALRQFEQLRQVLRDQLGVSPGQVSMSLYEEALSLDVPEVPSPAERAQALLAWGVVHWERRDTEEAERTARSARALAIDAGLGRELAEASELLGLIAYAQGRWRQVFADEFIESIRNTPELAPFLLDAHMCMSEFALGEIDGLERVADLARVIDDAAAEAGSDQGRALGLLLQGETDLLGGTRNPASAIECLEAAERLHAEIGSTTGTVLALERLAQADDLRGDRASAGRRHREALEISLSSSVRRHLVPFVFGGMLGGLTGTQAYDVLTEAETTTAGLDLCPPCAMAYRLGAAQACVSVGQHDRAESYLNLATDVAEMWHEGPWHAAVDEARASLVLGSGGSREQVRDLLESAVSTYAKACRHRDEARCRRSLVEVLSTQERLGNGRPHTFDG